MEKNRSKLWLALKYLRGQGHGFINRSHWLTIAGITLGVTALICVTSVMNGLREDVRQRITGTLSEIKLSAPGGDPVPRPRPLVDSLLALGYQAAPVIRSELILKQDDRIWSTLCFGIDPALHSKISAALHPRPSATGSEVQGILSGGVEGPEFTDNGIALGYGLAAEINARVGDELQLLSPVFDVPTAFGMLPKVRTVRVAAIFNAGMPEYNSTFSFVPLATAAFFRGYADEVDYIEVKSPDASSPQRHTSRIRSLFKGWQVEDWSAYDANLYSALRFEKFLMFVIMLFTYVIASFNLTGSMLKTIAQKKRELGLLKAFGYRETDLRDLFLYQSLILATIGIILGLVISTALLLVQKRFGLLSMGMGDAGPLPLPVIFSFQDYLTVVLVSYFITLVSVILPLQRLKRIKPIELIRQTT
ncbi:MAG TPA: ABC transporter permease [Candidatus Syntrophosphaera sp.]|jgi:lipoprotein-releasing system permease protein|nr:ABC transporter permease [Candidatus Cloacimonadota bacterium]HNU54745.1 ABC transporter permease [Candidatus Syntrophosphaera sp.]HPW38923.1 ABC transporter permease [Candidatus Syntrophosphaera sp.]HQC47557.1 ABC transporter permease [Candidatus Syntrophosphaera sp.]